MSWLDLPYAAEDEQIDDPTHPYADLTQSMGDVARANRCFWGTSSVLIHVARLLRGVPAGTTVRVLDIATGSADIPHALRAWSAKRGIDLCVIGVDNMSAMLRMARERHPEVPVVRADAARLPFAPRSFDIAICALAFHHFGFDLSVRVLAAMDLLTKRGFVVSDLRRDRMTLLAVRTGMTLIRAHPFTLHDAPTSVKRAFTPREYEKMIALSGVRNIRTHSHGYVRIALVQQKEGTSPIVGRTRQD